MTGIEPRAAALLAMDFQNAIVANYAQAHPAVLAHAARAQAAARSAGMAVIHVAIGFRPGYPEVAESNRMFGGLKQSGRFAAGSSGAEIHPSLAPREGDLTVTKHRVSAFSGSDLEMLLRAGGIGTLVLTGIATSGVVLSTLRQAADLDFRLVVLRDACLDADAEVQRVLMEKVFVRQAEVVGTDEFEASLGLQD